MVDFQLLKDLNHRLDPTQPIQAPSQRWYVEPPDGVAVSLARSLQLDPTSSHLLVGSIGCGKSTALLAAGRHLLETEGIFARYTEVSRAIDLDVSDGVAVAIAVADELVTYLDDRYDADSEIRRIRRYLDPFVNGREYESFGYNGHDEPGGGYDPPIVRRPRPNVPDAMLRHLPTLTDLKEAVHRLTGGRLVWLLDGLDRISDPLEFDRIVEPFLQGMKEIGVGVAVVGPRRVAAGVDRLGAPSAFDELHRMGPVDPADPAGRAFLLHVLQARKVGEIVPAEEQEELIRLSGGAMRILLQLTREAIKETWVRNNESLGGDQVAVAADKVGRGLLLGLSDPELALLKSLLVTGTFAVRSKEDAALVLTNRVLEHLEPSGLSKYSVHPCLVPFVKALPEPVKSNA